MEESKIFDVIASELESMEEGDLQARANLAYECLFSARTIIASLPGNLPCSLAANRCDEAILWLVNGVEPVNEEE